MIFRIPLIFALALVPAPLSAQATVQPIGVSDADALAEQVRRLGANPLDLDALLTAAELSLKLDDLSAAGSFLARAEKISPTGARGLAIRGAILVRSERPGEALRQFAQAEALGLAPARFAADRGLAYDLIGDQPRAQREYRLALRDGGGGDETQRRYALSLGISGKQREALDELAPAVRRNDRAAWRTRAFVLAMGGDAAEASRIASTMMPPGSAQGLKAFFDELPRLPAIDRAFAVHFGEVRASSARLTDARLAPPLAPLPAEPAPVQVAAVVTPVPPRDKGKRKDEKLKPGRVAITYAPTPAPTVVAADVPSQPPAYQAPIYQPPIYQPPVRSQLVVAANTADRPLTPGEQASLAAATLRPRSRRNSRPPAPVAVTPPPAPLVKATEQTVAAAAPIRPQPQRPVEVAAVVPTPSPVPDPVRTATPGSPASVAASAGGQASALAVAPVTLAMPRFVTPTPAVMGPPETASTPAVQPAATTATPTTPPPAVLAPAAPSPAAAAVTTTPLAPLVSPPPGHLATVVMPAPRPARTRSRADDILAKIVANLSIPAAELGVDKAATPGKPSRVDKSAPDTKPVPEKKSPAERKADAKKALADRKAAAEKKALAEEEAAEKRAARAEPARIWVQVAGGANERDLAKAWKSAQARSPVLAGKRGYTTPLHATNRVLTGPFKTDAEARAYVNQLAKSGVSAFSFTSDAGQKVSRLGGK